MSTVLEWFLVGLVLAVGAAVVAAACAALSWTAVGNTVRDIEPRRRFWLLSALVVSPIVAIALVLLFAFYPSALDVIGLVSMHCGAHCGHSFHLCFVHHSPPPVSAPILWLSVGLFAVVCARWGVEVAAITASLRRARQLAQMARFDDERGIHVVESDRHVAMTVGLFRRRIVVSDRLEQYLSPQQFAAVIAHEQAHCRRFDGLIMLFLRMAAAFHLPGIRAELSRELRLASEQCCDQAAANDDRLTVAETILAVERHHQQLPALPGVERFGASDIEQRVQGLLRDDWRRPNRVVIAVVALTAAVVVFSNLHSLHHLTELAFAWLV